MSSQTKTLIAMALFVIFCLGSFIWFVATWGSRHSDQAQMHPATFVEVV